MRAFPPQPPKSPAGHWSPLRNRSTQAAFRRGVIRIYGDRCIICGAQPVQAHHTVAGSDDPRTGRPLCRTHHRAADPHAR